MWRRPCWACGRCRFGTAAGLGDGLGAAGQFADLCESLLKRSVQVKDSGAVVPQFGGVLDILDSAAAVGPGGLGDL